MPSAIRLALAALLAFTVPATAAAAVTHHCLAGTDWTRPAPTATVSVQSPSGPAPATPATAQPAPDPSHTPDPWPLGTCLTEQLQRTTCPGALRVVGWVRHPDTATPCAGIPGTPLTRHSGAYALCLTR